MDINRFKELWQLTINSVIIEMRKSKNPNRINLKNISNYYRNHLVSGLWFSRTFANDFNEWIAANVEHSKQVRIKKVMLNLKVEKNSAKVVLASSTAIAVMALLMYFASPLLSETDTSVAQMAFFCLMIQSLCYGAWHFIKVNGTSTQSNIIKELERIGKEVESILNE